MPRHYINFNFFKKSKKNQTGSLRIRTPFERYILKGSIIGLTGFLATLLSASILAPVEVTDAATVLSALSAGDSAVSISTSASTIDLSLSAGTAGSVRTAMDTVSVTAGNNGYQLYLSASGNTNALIRDGATSTGTDATTGAPTYASSDIIPTLTSSGELVPITSPTNLENNTWGFAVPATNSTSGSGSEDVVTTGFDASYPTGDNSSASSKFASIPVRGNDILIAKRSSSADAVPTNFYYGIKANSSKPSGLYQNTITYTAIGDSTTTGLASISPERTNQLAGGIILSIATPSTATLSSLGTITVTVGGEVCASPSATKSDGGSGIYVNVTCTSPALATGWHSVVVNFAGAGETYVVNPGIEYYSDQETVIGMQDFTLAQCGEMLTGDTVLLKDTRDGKVYSAAKMADGHCWMTQNLRIGDTNQDIVLTSDDSDIPEGEDDFVLAKTGVQPSTSTSTGTNWQTTPDAVHVYSFAGTSNELSYGNLYNWYTATASSGNSSTPVNTDVTSSICPKGWTLPKNIGDGSFLNLVRSSGITSEVSGTSATVVTNLQRNPLNFVLSGLYYSSLVYQGVYGVYWAKTSDSFNTDYAMSLSFNASNGDFRLQDVNLKYYGRAVRCVMKTADHETMQDFAAGNLSYTCSGLGVGAVKELYDTRDDNVYEMYKQADGNCWMHENLRLGTANDGSGNQTVTLTADNSDFPSDKSPYTIALSSIQNKDTTNTNWQTVDDWEVNHVYSFVGTVNSGTDRDSDGAPANPSANYGNLYNWYTATAGTGLHSSFPANTDATASICPKGWKLPPNTGNGSYTRLMQSTPSTRDIAISEGVTGATATSGTSASYVAALQAAPLSFVLSGYYRSSLVNQGVFGYYWSRTSSYLSNTDNSMDLYFSTFNSSFGLQNNNEKFVGFAVRCVLIP